jgi:flagellar basal-body rod protein FlgB
MSMIDDPTITALARFLDVNVFRSELVMSNMANIDTPGYRTRDVNFSREMQRAEGNLEYAAFSPATQEVRGLMERPDGNNVSLERESLLLADTQLRFNLGVQLLRDEFKGILSAINGGSGGSGS